MLFLDHDIIFYFQTMLKNPIKKFKWSFEYFWNIMENGAFAPNQIHDISKAL